MALGRDGSCPTGFQNHVRQRGFDAPQNIDDKYRRGESERQRRGYTYTSFGKRNYFRFGGKCCLLRFFNYWFDVMVRITSRLSIRRIGNSIPSR